MVGQLCLHRGVKTSQMPASASKGERKKDWGALWGALLFISIPVIAQFALPGGILRPLSRTTGVFYKQYDAIIFSSSVVRDTAKIRSRPAAVWKVTASAVAKLPDGSMLNIDNIGVFGPDRKFSSESLAATFQSQHATIGMQCKAQVSIITDDCCIVTPFDSQKLGAILIGLVMLVLCLAGSASLARFVSSMK